MVLKYTTWIFNLDGFVWNWRELNPQFIKIFNHLKSEDKKIILLSNNSAYSKAQYVKKLYEKGLEEIEEKNLFLSSDALIHHLHNNKIYKVYLIGEYGLLKDLEKEGIEISKSSDHIVVGIDRTLTYEKLRQACVKIATKGENEVYLYHLDNAVFWKIGEELYPITLPVLSYLEECGKYTRIFVGKPSVIFKNALLSTYSIYPSTTIFVTNSIN
ncbi:MAG: hypothetical protein GXN99_01700, partial [Candidatus Nanohaloarchaeota archaeon]|nr:hypothetical protein [Candidatus Nanohaloarchaeota archaeon]